MLRVSASDSDAGANGVVSYSIAPSSGGGGAQPPFNIGSLSGEIVVAGVVDREQAVSWTFAVVATDGGSPPLAARADVTVYVDDLNDNDPLVPSSHVVMVPENASIGLVLVSVAATDPDAGGNGTSGLHYALASDTDAAVGDYVAVDATTGQVTLAQPLDRETTSCVVFSVETTDSGGRTSSTAVRMVVLDANDHAPAFVGGNGTRVYNVSESAPLGRVAVLAATDPDDGANGVVTYTLTALDNASFASVKIDPRTGELSVTGLDYERISAHVLVVTATDGGIPSRSTSVTVVINVVDVNEHAPVARLDPPPFSSSSSSFPRVWVPSNLAPNSIVTRVIASDGDTSNMTLSTTSPELSFALSSPTGAAAFAVRADGAVVLREGYSLTRGQEFNVTVVVSDAGPDPMSTEVRFSVAVSASAHVQRLSLAGALERAPANTAAGTGIHSVGLVYGDASSGYTTAQATAQGVAVGIGHNAAFNSTSVAASSSNVTLSVHARSLASSVTVVMATNEVYSGDPVVMAVAQLWSLSGTADVVPASVRLELQPVTPSGGPTPPALCVNMTTECAPREGSNTCLLAVTVPPACFLGGVGRGQTLAGSVAFVDGREQAAAATTQKRS